MEIIVNILIFILFYMVYIMIGILVTSLANNYSDTLNDSANLNVVFIFVGWPILLIVIIIKFLKDVIEMLKDFDFKKHLRIFEFQKNLKQILKEILD